jgi:hypothetical protein
LDSRSIDNTVSLDVGQEWNFKYTVKIPGFAPSGSYQIVLEVKNLEGAVVKCLVFKLDL